MSSEAPGVVAMADHDQKDVSRAEAGTTKRETLQTAFQSFSKGFSSLKALNVLHRDGKTVEVSKDGGRQRSLEKEKENAGAGMAFGGRGENAAAAGGGAFNLFSQGFAGIKSSPLLSMRGSSLLAPKKVSVVEMSAEDSAAVAATAFGGPPTAALSSTTSNASPPSRPAPSSETGSSLQSQQDSPLGIFTKGLATMKNTAIKSVTTKARHLVSQNKRRYQADGFDLDMSYITENVIAMGFPAGDISSGLFGYMEGLYRNHMEEVIRFFDTHHKGCYKVYNLCSERLYDASLFEGKVACFPFDDHNCPPLQMLTAFCESAYAWLKEGMDNVVVVHCKAGMARTGLMICCLLLYLKFFPTAEEAIAYFNSKRCVDGLALVIPSQQRYVKYFEIILRDLNGESPEMKKRMLRGIRLHRCPYWIRPSITIYDHNGLVFSTRKHPRTRDLMPDDVWHNAPRKGVAVFALPGERCVTELCGDFKVCFHDRHGDFSCWLNTSMMESRQMLSTREIDAFDKRRLPSPGLIVEIVVLDVDAPQAGSAQVSGNESSSAPSTAHPAATRVGVASHQQPAAALRQGIGGRTVQEKGALVNSGLAFVGSSATVGGKMGGTKEDDIFSDSESEEGDAARKLRKPGGDGGGIVNASGVGDVGADSKRVVTGAGQPSAGGEVHARDGKLRQGTAGGITDAGPSTSMAATAMAIVDGMKNAMDSLRIGMGSGNTAVGANAGGAGSGNAAVLTKGTSRRGVDNSAAGNGNVDSSEVSGTAIGIPHLATERGVAGARLPSSPSHKGSPSLGPGGLLSAAAVTTAAAAAAESETPFASNSEACDSGSGLSVTEVPSLAPLSLERGSDGGSALPAADGGSSSVVAANQELLTGHWARVAGGLDVERDREAMLSDGRTTEEVLNSFTPSSDFQAMAADTSVFTFGEDESDEED